MTKVGIAMIARNAEELMPHALDPLVEHVDEIAIVLGGISSDGTPELAEQYATLPVEQFSGKVDEHGRLMNFGQARQQSFEILKRAGVDYALVVDTDDQWQNPDKLRLVLNHMVNGGFPMTMFPYTYEGGMFVQPRLYDATRGHWEGPCHNYWVLDEGERVALQSAELSIQQVRPSSNGANRREQNVRISQEWMAENGDNARLLLHMAKDALVDRNFEIANDALENRYFPAYEADGKRDAEELYNAWHTLAGMRLVQDNPAGAFEAAVNALTVREHGQSWAIAAEAAEWLGKSGQVSRPMLRLAAFCADMAIETGKARGNLHWHSERLTTWIPMLVKARALCGLGEFRRARGVLDLALIINPDNEDMTLLRRDICRKLGELE
jgi:glycosyltransferase involved in cell wall biosynthesis